MNGQMIKFGDLGRKPTRIVVALVSLMIGVGLLAGLNISLDTLDNSVETRIRTQLGNTHALIRNKTISSPEGYFNITSLAETLDTIEEVEKYTPRSGSGLYGWTDLKTGGNTWVWVNGLWVDPAVGEDFGHCRIDSRLPNPSVTSTNNVEPFIDPTLWGSLGITNPVAITIEYAEEYAIALGDGLKFGGVTFNVTAIIADYTEGVRSFPMDDSYIYYEFLPYPTATYINISYYWNILGHAQEANFMLLQFKAGYEDTTLEIASESEMEKNYYVVFDPFAQILSGAGQMNLVLRIFFTLVAMVALLISAIPMKNVLNLSLAEATSKYGAKTPGYSSKLSIIVGAGVLGGFGLGTLLALTFGGNFITVIQFLKEPIFQNVPVAFQVLPLTLLLSLGAGFTIPFLMGLYSKRRVGETFSLRARDSVTKTVVYAIIAITFAVGGYILNSYGSNSLTSSTTPNFTELLNLSFTFLGSVLFLLGLIFIFTLSLPYLQKGLSALIHLCALKWQAFGHRNLIQDRNRSRNMFIVIALGFSIFISFGTFMKSITDGAYPGAVIYLGGDFELNYYGGGIGSANKIYDEYRNFPHVTTLIPFSTRSKLGVFSGEHYKIGDFGGEITYQGEFWYYANAFQVNIANITEYIKMYQNNLVLQQQLVNPRTSVPEFFEPLKTPFTVVLEDKAATRMGLTVGDTVELVIDNLRHDFTVVGITKVIPGNWHTFIDETNPTEENLYALISWETIDALEAQFLGDIDFIIKRDYTTDNYGRGFNATDLINLLRNITETEAVETRLTSFSEVNPSYLKYQVSHDFTYYNVTPPVMGSWVDYQAQFIAANFTPGTTFGNATILGVNATVPADRRDSVADILAYYNETYPTEKVCVVNSRYIKYALGSNIRTDTIYTFQPGDIINLKNGAVDLNFTVVATVAGHSEFRNGTTSNSTNWDYQPSEKVGNILNFDNEDVETDNLFDSKITTFSYKDFNFIYVPQYTIANDLASDPTTFLATLGLSFYGATEQSYAPWDLANIAYVKFASNANHTLLNQTLHEYFANTTGYSDFLALSAEQELRNAASIYLAYLKGGIDDPNNLPLVEETYRSTFNLGDAYYFYTARNYMAVTPEYMGMIYNSFILWFWCAIVLAITGTSTSALLVLYQHRKEIQTAGARDLRRMDLFAIGYIEPASMGIIALGAGFLGGILGAYQLHGEMPYLVYIPLAFSFDWGLCGLMLGISVMILLAFMIAPAIKAVKLKSAPVEPEVKAGETPVPAVPLGADIATDKILLGLENELVSQAGGLEANPVTTLAPVQEEILALLEAGKWFKVTRLLGNTLKQLHPSQADAYGEMVRMILHKAPALYQDKIYNNVQFMARKVPPLLPAKVDQYIIQHECLLPNETIRCSFIGSVVDDFNIIEGRIFVTNYRIIVSGFRKASSARKGPGGPKSLVGAIREIHKQLVHDAIGKAISKSLAGQMAAPELAKYGYFYPVAGLQNIQMGKQAVSYKFEVEYERKDKIEHVTIGVLVYLKRLKGEEKVNFHLRQQAFINQMQQALGE